MTSRVQSSQVDFGRMGLVFDVDAGQRRMRHADDRTLPGPVRVDEIELGC